MLIAGTACAAVLPDRTSQTQLTAASPGTWIRVQGAGFRVGEYVDIVVVDPAGSQASIGRLIADGKGDIDAEVAPGQQARNGVSLIRLNGTESQRTATLSISLTGGSDAGASTGQPQWNIKTGADTSPCEQCLLVHGQAP